MIRRAITLTALLCWTVLAPLAMSQSSTSQAKVTGTVGTPQRIELPPDAGVKQMSGHSQNADGRQMVALTETYWKLIELNGKAVKMPEGTAEAHIVLHTEGKKIAAFGGCNRMFGTYELNGSSLRFGAMGSTMMACAEPVMKQEGLFIKALQATNTFSIAGKTLELHDEKTVLARFHAEAMK